MNKRIVINKGDEYRFKTEKKFEEKDFFYDVYQKAERVTEEILETMRQSREELSKTKAHFYGIGNNIIVFCGTRGEGKTSALQSFAYQLKHAESKDKNKEYIVLDTIDPSELDSEESIVRVFLSRLFSYFHTLYDKSKKSDSNYDEKEMNIDRREILDKFNKCYNNLMNMGQKRKQDTYQDNLDCLSELGDSRNLRTNLFLVAEKVLDYKKKYCSGDSDSRQYLVVLIDDADLSMGNIFKICEDIRNYFSIPNAVVLMAADFEQLRSAIYQKYLKHYKTILKYDKYLKYKNKCYSMATKFMEKMFPNGHRIELPNINHEIQRNANSLKLEYREECEDKKDNKAEPKYVDVFAKEEWENCKDMQEQLIRSLYKRTGVIIEKRNDIQTFLPHTLRELTHFLKLLDSMEVVDFEMAVLEGTGRVPKKSEDDMPNLLRWKNNLEELKRYYLRYWIQNYLKNEQAQLIKQMDKVNQYDKVDQMGKLILAYIERNRKKNDKEIDTEDTIEDFAYLLYHIIRKSKVLKRELKDAIYIYFSIVLNSDFVQELILHKDFSGFVSYLKMPFYYDTVGNNGLEYFSFSVDRFKEYTTIIDLKKESKDTVAARYRKLFCIGVKDTLSGKRENTRVLHFNALGAFLEIMSHSEWLNLKTNTGTEFDGEGNSLEEMEPTEDGQVNIGTFKENAGALISAKNIICNLEMRFRIENVLKEFLPEWNEQNAIVLMKSYDELYTKIDDIMNDMTYLGTKSTIGRLLISKLRDDYGTLWQCSYLSNADYRTQYLAGVKQDIQSLIENSEAEANLLKKQSCKDRADIGHFKDNVAKTVSDIVSGVQKYSFLESVVAKDDDFAALQEVQKNIRQAWETFSTRVKGASVLTEEERDEWLSDLEDVLVSTEADIKELAVDKTATIETKEAQATIGKKETVSDEAFRTGKS